MNPSDSFIQGFFEKCAANGMSDLQAATLYELWLEKVASQWAAISTIKAPPFKPGQSVSQHRNAIKEQIANGATGAPQTSTQQPAQQPQQQQPAQQAPAQPAQQSPAQPAAQQPAAQQQQPQQQGNGGGGLWDALKGAWNGAKAIGRGIAAVGNTVNNTVGPAAIRNAWAGAADKVTSNYDDKNQGTISALWNRSLPGMAWNAMSGAAQGYGQGASEAIWGKSAAALGLCKVAAAYGMISQRELNALQKQALSRILGRR